jgi:HD-like signal output (HDOD) protein
LASWRRCVAKKSEEIRGQLEAKLGKRSHLATLAGIVRRVESIIGDSHSSAHELGHVIGSDPVLTAKVLHVVNSAAFAGESRIASVDAAVVRLGFERVKSVCVGVLSRDSIRAPVPGRSFMAELWCHALATSAGVEYLYDRLPVERGHLDRAVTAGLLCNIGRIIIMEWFPEEARRILGLVESSGMTMLNAERKELGVTHAEIGSWAAHYWEFDEVITSIVRYHHGPEKFHGVDVVNLAYVCAQAKLAGSPGEKHIVPLLPGLFERLGIDEGVLDDHLRGLSKVYAGLDPVFEIMRQS